MANFSRRTFLQGAAAAASSLLLPDLAHAAKAKAHIVIIGAGFGGLSAARYLNMYAPNATVTIIDEYDKLITCPFSNTVLGGVNDIRYITHSYEKVAARERTQFVKGFVREVDAAKRVVKLSNGKKIGYDKLIVSPGIAFKYSNVEGMSAKHVKTIPHAWKAGKQTLLLKQQIDAMKDGGVMVISVPSGAYRCPPAPYERASMVAHHLLQTNRKKSKIIILDHKDKFAKMKGFQKLWPKLFGNMIEWVPVSEGGRLLAIDPKARTFEAEADVFKGDVLNFIPPQTAGVLAYRAGLVDGATGWCPVDRKTFRSTEDKNIYVIGDAADASKMPKSGVSANAQGKVAALAIAAELAGIDPVDPSYSNACYTMVGPNHAIPIAHTYRYDAKKKLIVSSHDGSLAEPPKPNPGDSAKMAAHWYKSITTEMTG